MIIIGSCISERGIDTCVCEDKICTSILFPDRDSINIDDEDIIRNNDMPPAEPKGGE